MISEEYADIVAKRIVPTEDEGIRLILRNCVQSTKFFAQTFLQETFCDPMTYQHDEVWDMVDDETVPKTCICAWRGFGKSSIIGAKIIKSILFRQHRFVLHVSKTHDFAATETESIKQELLANAVIREVFGSIKAQEYSDVDLSFSRKSWFACDPKTGEPICFVVPKGANQQVRGSKVRIFGKNQRPTFISIDDLEDDEEILNEESRRKLRRWFNGALQPCVDPRHTPNPRTNRWVVSKDPEWIAPWRIFYIDTLKHQDANMAHLLESSDWRGVTFPQAEMRTETDPATGKERKQFYSLVPEVVTHAQIRRMVKVAQADGTMDEFARERLCLPTSPDTACWTPDSFKHYHDSKSNLNSNPNVFRFIIVDPAKTAKQSSAYTAILGVAADRMSRKIYFRDLVNQRLEPEQITQRTFEMAIALNTPNIAVEETGLGDIIKFMFENAARTKGLHINWEWLKATRRRAGDYGSDRNAAKVARASMVLPHYRAGSVYHDYTLKHSALERQMLSYPLCTNWDALDCAGYVPQVMQRYKVYFEPEAKDAQKTYFEEDIEYRELDSIIENHDWAVI